MIAIFAVLRPFLPYIGALLFVVVLWGTHKAQVWNADRTGYNRGTAEVQALWDADSERREAAATQLVTLWQEQRARADTASATLEKVRRETFERVRAAAVNLPAAVASIRFPAAAVGVLNDGVSAANRETARPPEGADGRAATVATDTAVVDVTVWGVEVAKLYANCADQVRGWQSFYSGLQAAQPKE